MKIALIGHGGHSRVIKNMLINENELAAILDDQYSQSFIEKDIYYGPISDAKKLKQYFDDVKFVIAIGENKARKSIFDRLGFTSEHYITLVHCSAVVCTNTVLGAGTIVMPGAVINPDTFIGEQTIINTNAVIEHDCVIADYVHISPNATLTGGVRVENGAHIGAGAVIIPQKTIGEWAIIGAGATVIHNIPDKCTAVGVPAQVKKTTLIGGV